MCAEAHRFWTAFMWTYSFLPAHTYILHHTPLTASESRCQPSRLLARFARLSSALCSWLMLTICRTAALPPYSGLSVRRAPSCTHATRAAPGGHRLRGSKSLSTCTGCSLAARREASPIRPGHYSFRQLMSQSVIHTETLRCAGSGQWFESSRRDAAPWIAPDKRVPGCLCVCVNDCCSGWHLSSIVVFNVYLSGACSQTCCDQKCIFSALRDDDCDP